MKKPGMRMCGLMVALGISVGAAPTEAQDADQSEPVAAQDAEQQEQVVELGELQVVGSRVAGRSAQDSLVPVDIIQGEDLTDLRHPGHGLAAVRQRALL